MGKTGKRCIADRFDRLIADFLQGKERKKWIKFCEKPGVSKLDLAAEDEFWYEPWRRHWHRKRELRRHLLCSYMLLIFFTVLFGVMVLGLGLRAKNFKLGGAPSQDESDTARIIAVVKNARPTAKELRMLNGAVLPDAVLRHWGEVRRLTNGSGDVDLLYFAGARVYLLRGRSDRRILYAGRKKP